MDNKVLIGMPVDKIPTPALLVDADILERNINYMKEYLEKTNTKIRPHTKTHKSPMIAHLQMRAGAIGLCCATVGEAEAMVYSGLDNIFIANEIIGEDKINRVVNLAKYAEMIVAFDDEENLYNLSKAAEQKGVTLGVLVDVDVGMNRCGVRNKEDAILLAKKAYEANNIKFLGVFGYEGHAVFIEDKEERVKAGRKANKYLVDIAKAIEAEGLPVEIVSAAGTGTYDIAAEYPGITEIEAGSYVFMDGTYEKLNLPFEQALTVLSTVVSRPDKTTLILDVGMKGISVERACPAVQGNLGIEILKLSEAHAKSNIIDPNAVVKTGEKLNLVPSHCCTTVSLYDELYVIRKGKVEAIWPITARGAY